MILLGVVVKVLMPSTKYAPDIKALSLAGKVRIHERLGQPGAQAGDDQCSVCCA